MTTTQVPTDVPALQQENERLRRAVEELSILNDLARAIGASSNSEEVMNTIINRSVKAVGAEQGTISLVDDEMLVPTKTLVRAAATGAGHGKFHVTDALLGWMMINRKPLIVNEPQTDQRFRAVDWDPAVRSLVSVPLMVKSNLNGILTLYNRKRETGFDQEDARLLAIIATQSAQIVEATRLYEQERQLNKIREQVALAAEVQQHLLPKALPPIPGYEIAGSSIAAQEIGGDYYDAIAAGDNRFAICLGDVSGKGIPASLLMANVQAMIRILARFDLPPHVSMQHANGFLYESTSTEKFVTFFHSVLDAESGTLDFCNAGHNPPLLLNASGCERLRTKNIVLGIVPDYDFQTNTIKLESGDVLVIYSDGVTEAVNQFEDEFGEEKLLGLVQQHRFDNADTIRDAILGAVKRHTGDLPPHDDVTLVVLKKL